MASELAQALTREVGRSHRMPLGARNGGAWRERVRLVGKRSLLVWEKQIRMSLRVLLTKLAEESSGRVK
jgi:hypothetical protein